MAAPAPPKLLTNDNRSESLGIKLGAWVIVAGFVLVGLFGLNGNARADETKPLVTVDPADDPLLLEGVVGQDESFSAPLRLVEKNGVDAPITFITSDLTSTQSNISRVSRDNVHVEGPSTLPAGAVTDYKVTVSGVVTPATYDGTIHVLQPGEHPLEGLEIALQVVARAESVLNPVGNAENPQLKVINCKALCFLSELVPDVLDNDRFSLVFQNPSRQAFTVVDASVFLQDTSGNTLGEDQVSFVNTPPFGLKAQSKEQIDLVIHRNLIPAGHYTGYYSIQLEGAKDPIKSNLDLSVRDGPLLPLFIVILGVVLGRLIKRSQETRTGAVAGVPAAEAAPRSSAGAHWWRKVLNWTSGVRTKATKAGVRFSIWAITLLVIVGIGYYNTYVKQGATFGANVIPDILALLTFGLSGEVAGASLSALPTVSE